MLIRPIRRHLWTERWKTTPRATGDPKRWHSWKIMRELDSSEQVVWPAWCYSGKIFTIYFFIIIIFVFCLCLFPNVFVVITVDIFQYFMSRQQKIKSHLLCLLKNSWNFRLWTLSLGRLGNEWERWNWVNFGLFLYLMWKGARAIL